MLRSHAQCFEVDAVPVLPLDTLGAGDTFVARTLYGLLKGEEPQSTLQAAAAAAAETCLYYGAIGHGVPLQLSGRVPELEDVLLSAEKCDSSPQS